MEQQRAAREVVITTQRRLTPALGCGPVLERTLACFPSTAESCLVSPVPSRVPCRAEAAPSADHAISRGARNLAGLTVCVLTRLVASDHRPRQTANGSPGCVESHLATPAAAPTPDGTADYRRSGWKNVHSTFAITTGWFDPLG